MTLDDLRPPDSAITASLPSIISSLPAPLVSLAFRTASSLASARSAASTAKLSTTSRANASASSREVIEVVSWSSLPWTGPGSFPPPSSRAMLSQAMCMEAASPPSSASLLSLKEAASNGEGPTAFSSTEGLRRGTLDREASPMLVVLMGRLFPLSLSSAILSKSASLSCPCPCSCCPASISSDTSVISIWTAEEEEEVVDVVWTEGTHSSLPTDFAAALAASASAAWDMASQVPLPHECHETLSTVSAPLPFPRSCRNP